MVKKFLSNALKLVLFLGLGATILILLYRNLNAKYQLTCAEKGIAPADCSLLDKVWQDFQGSNFILLMVVVLCYMLSNVHRTYRWKMLIDSLGYRTRFLNVFNSTMLLYFSNLGFPRIGEFVRAGAMAKYEHVPFEKLMGTVTVDRIFDMISFAIVFALALCFEFDTLWNFVLEQRSGAEAESSNTLYYIGAGAVLFVAVLYGLRSKLAGFPLVQKLQKMLIGFVDGIRSVNKLQNIPAFVFHSVMIWVMYYLMTYICFFAFAPTAHLGLEVALMVFVFGSLGMIIPSPGGMGSYHTLVVAGLVLYGISSDDAFSFAMIIFFTVNILGNVLFGIIALISMPLMNRNYEPQITPAA
ncbi:MAG: flippase-like domain-containing protein [Saprospiraceae bacterium]|nr:flippase-like domain-containing protein [Saprospiraceae bacterium]